MVLLHGVLDVHVHEGKDMPTSLVNQASGLLKRIICCGMGPSLVGSTDPYLCLDVGKTRRMRTAIVQSTNDPVWDEKHEVYVADEAEELRIEVKDADIVGAEYLGQAIIPVSSILDGKVFDQWLPLTDPTGKPMGVTNKLTKEFSQAQVHLTVKYTAVEQLQAARDAMQEVPRTYFPLRGGNRLTLYHDAVCTPGPVPGIPLAAGGLYSESSCWDDIYDAILHAKRFIWITGWSVWDKTRLCRTPDRDETSPTLGELLVQKANKGVNVLLLVWDDTTNNLGLHPGLMATHDQETYTFFKDTEVTCVLCPRQGGVEETVLQKFSTGNMFTHHQKTIILDAAMEEAPAEPEPATLDNLGTPRAADRSNGAFSGQRRVLAFVGGLDLCDGRYDRHDHPMFETLGAGGVHAEDFHQACVDAFDPTKRCLREPWHDIHARVEGPTAMDICLNFMERWAKQAGTTNLTKMRHLDDHNDIHLPAGFDVFTSKAALLKQVVAHGGHIPVKISTIKAQDPSLNIRDIPAHEAWSVQLFRSIDSDSAEGFPKNASEGSYEAGLSVGKGKIVDASIHRAYINLIRNAKRYLYIENQYFLGSAHLWDSDTETSCYNQVPAEIALKIAHKIKAGEPFRVYICTPMYPEGIPTSGSVQAILYFQAKTRQMMYKRVADAIAEAGLTGQAHPQDYLQFFCLGKREGYSSPTSASFKAATELPATSPGEVSLCTPEEMAAAANGTAAAATAPGALPPPDPASCQGKATANRRFMIYVHSKLMIVDDEYVVVGSANINQRSLEGTRDSEICIGAFQNGYIMRSASDPLPQGQVSGFRKVLWQEHIGALAPEHQDPSSLACMQSLRQIGEANWLAYTSPDVQPLPHGHLMNYPNSVGPDGSVTALSDCEDFPDLGGKIMGTKSTVLPSLLTA